MRTEHERPRAYADDLPELEGEGEIDFGRIGRTLARRWWLVAAALALGGIIGYLASLGGGDVYVARTTIYLGNPLSPNGNAQIQSLATNPATVTEIVRSDAVVQRVADEVGVRPDRLRQGISTRSLVVASATTQRATNQNPLVQVSVRGPWGGDTTATAANLLADAVITEVSGYVDAKIGALEERLAAQNRELGTIDAQVAELARAAENAGLSPTERLNVLVLANLAEQRRGLLLDRRTETEQQLTLAETVERGKQVTEPRASRVPAQSPRSSIIVGALIGLLAGAALALLWEPLVGRRRSSS
jgi:capsular polysaccharide biosynthesis protein